MELTDAGRSYVEHARISVAFGERAMRSAKETREGAETVLQIGKSPNLDPVLIEVLYSIRLPLFTTLDIGVHSESSSDLAHDLMSANLDVALITQPEQNAKLTMTKLAETPSRDAHLVLVHAFAQLDLQSSHFVSGATAAECATQLFRFASSEVRDGHGDAEQLLLKEWNTQSPA
jgi:LysR family hca operon transcriptional activator